MLNLVKQVFFIYFKSGLWLQALSFVMGRKCRYKKSFSLENTVLNHEILKIDS